ncbi:formyl transferase [Phyllosticta citricarpa]|uniref:methionyl-tRNA formyltransferase n=1 Tax=Phyllosticta paracitricarpa TaxID=2016321 RepID=A0ABR1NC19_9PEZI
MIRPCLSLRLAPAWHRLGARYSSSKASEPLRILFCGTDDFSAAALQALHQEHQQNPGLIDTLHVAHRPGKFGGRGNKIWREAPIQSAAQQLGLTTHVIDTFTGWTPPTAFNLIIAVSFGLFVPPRILSAAKYGGLNVHPSLLPDLYGPAPLVRALLNGDKKTGVTVQTLHHAHFDRGTIIEQTPYPGIDFPDPDTCTPTQLSRHLAPIGATMLVNVLRSRTFVPPLKEVGSAELKDRPIRHAPKITKEDMHVDFKTWTSDRVVRTLRILGELWDDTIYEKLCNQKDDGPKRIKIHKISVAELDELESDIEIIPEPFWSPLHGCVAHYTSDRKIVCLESFTIEGQGQGKGNSYILPRLKDEFKSMATSKD